MALFALEINVLDFVHPAVATLEKNLAALSSQKVMKFGGMSNGVGQMVTNVTRMAKPGEVDVLHLWSHGSSGGQGVSTGFPDARFSVRGQRAGISQSSLPDISTDIKRLAPYFSKRGRIELRGCSVGVGDDGPRLLRALAELVGTDVYAALNAQPIGPIQWAGPVVRMRPDGSSTAGSGPDIR